ncbi:PREDICTED: lipoma HMGIC fusion partner-like 1 protein isoform X1 [Diuraphis noxia]|uniref:lipoma HMGIC fusion partner-like 1 protein isoform X1 n=1 Tax=Diuraphis noxia TaxID=143948 RepID=UPI0007637B46|nr:PREDICTED: lipoma HMGIC fusion partner-like 1 protein isoform X1 [Diuraphis noxia]
MATTLTVAGMCWATLSLAASFLCSFGFYLPFWIQGRLMDKADAYFSSFRRCNYPRLMSDGTVALVHECGRYAKFNDIPSVWWQISTILIGGATAITVIVAVSAVSACCVTHVIQKSTAKVAGYLQLLAAALVSSGGAIYPIGWDNREVKESCGNISGPYKLGTCHLSWSVYMLGSSVALLLLCFYLSFYSSRDSPGNSFRSI